MRTGDTRKDAPARTKDPGHPVQEPPPAEPAQTKRTLTHYVDPYDMSGESQPPDEPGYGHGV